MNEFINAVKDWPVIFQGAIGSAVFWLILTAGQVVFDYVKNKTSMHSTKSRESYLISKMCKYEAFLKEDTFALCAVSYRSSRFLYKGLMWLSLGFILQSIFFPAGMIGFIGCLYYIFNAYNLVAPWNKNENESLKQEYDKVVNELISLGKLLPEAKNADLSPPEPQK